MNEETHEQHEQASTSSDEVLVVASKVKAYIRAKSGMNTSASVMDALSARVRRLADEAIARAQADGRKTVMDRDFS
jgi:histone H3/H4